MKSLVWFSMLGHLKIKFYILGIIYRRSQNAHLESLIQMRICITERAKSLWLSGQSALLQHTVDVGSNPLIMQNLIYIKLFSQAFQLLVYMIPNMYNFPLRCHIENHTRLFLIQRQRLYGTLYEFFLFIIYNKISFKKKIFLMDH